MKKQYHSYRHAGKARSGRQAQQRGADNSLSRNQGANQQPMIVVQASSSRPHRNIDVFQTIAKLVRNMFDRLPRALQNLETKRSCVASVVDRHNDKVGDLGDWYGWLLKRAEEIRRTFDFKNVCVANALSSDEEQQAVSEHLVLEPKSVINKIRMEGLATYQGNIKMFRERLVPVEYRYEAKAAKAEAKEANNE